MAASAVAGATDAAEWLQGARLSVVTTDNAVVEGDVYACDPPAEVLVLRLPNTTRSRDPTVFDYRVINFPSIRSAKVLAPPGNPNCAPMPEPSFVATADLQRKKDRAVSQAKESLRKIGVGVTPVAQGIFNALDKTLPTKWKGTSIEVMDVLISPPYGKENCRLINDDGSKKKQAALEQVLKVLEMERRTRK